jgi:hypothetical protein
MTPLLLKRSLRIIGFLLMPLFCLTCLVTCGAVNPMSMGFLTTFEVVNSTAENLIITPIGARGSGGERGTLPVSTSAIFCVTSTQCSEFALPASSSISITYDCDDVQFSEIVCQRADGSHLVIPSGLHPTKGQYRAPLTKRFEITDLKGLQPASDLHLSALRPGNNRLATLYWLAGIGLLSPFCFWMARRA